MHYIVMQIYRNASQVFRESAVIADFGLHASDRQFACAFEAGQAEPQKLAGQLGFAEYARHQQPSERPLVLYERA